MLKFIGGAFIVVVVLVFAFFQARAGFVGIQFHMGSWWAWGSLLALCAGFALPITVGAFFGAMDVWKWHWSLAALFAAPGLLVAVPALFGSAFGVLRSLVKKVS